MIRNHHIVSPKTKSATLYTKYHDAYLEGRGECRPLLTEHIIFDPHDSGVCPVSRGGHIYMDRIAGMLYRAIGGPLLPPGLPVPKVDAFDLLTKE